MCVVEKVYRPHVAPRTHGDQVLIPIMVSAALQKASDMLSVPLSPTMTHAAGAWLGMRSTHR